MEEDGKQGGSKAEDGSREEDGGRWKVEGGTVEENSADIGVSWHASCESCISSYL